MFLQSSMRCANFLVSAPYLSGKEADVKIIKPVIEEAGRRSYAPMIYDLNTFTMKCRKGNNNSKSKNKSIDR